MSLSGGRAVRATPQTRWTAGSREAFRRIVISPQGNARASDSEVLAAPAIRRAGA